MSGAVTSLRRNGSLIPDRSDARWTSATSSGRRARSSVRDKRDWYISPGAGPPEYHNDPAKTAATINERGWRTLGDIGYRDGDGYLYLTDRQAHMIISGGVNIYPQEAENVLLGHPAVADVAVLGVPDPEMGETVKAVVELVDQASARPSLEADLLTYCRDQLATYKCPRSVDFVSELPRDESGKLFKRVLRERYWAGHENRVI